MSKRGYMVDRGGATHIWSVNRGIRMVGAVAFVSMAAIVCAVAVAYAATRSGSNRWGTAAIGGVVAVSAAWLGIRMARLRVEIGAGMMTVCNVFRTRTVNIGEIRDITLRPRAGPGHGPSWNPRIELTNGEHIWIDLNCGPAALDELRTLVGLPPLGADERDFLVSGTGEPALPASRDALPEVSGAIHAGWAEWAGSTRFSVSRLRPGYDLEEVDAFAEAIRDTFLGRREPPLTSDEVRVKLFSTTRLRPGYDEEEVDIFLAEAEQRLAALQRPTTDLE